MTAPEARDLLMHGHDKLITVRSPHGPGFHLLDGEGGGPPHVELCNDPRGTLLKANAELTDAGWLRVMQSRVPVFDLERSLQENARAELRITYDDDYWALHDVLGTSEEYALHVD